MADHPTPAPPGAPEENKTPTYTTVGSIYNRKAATPLKPPTRRSRDSRYIAATYHSPAGAVIILGPPTSLPALSAKETGVATSPMGANNVQKYSPLQQNYDRAVSPMPDQTKDVGINSPSVVDGAVHSQVQSIFLNDTSAMPYTQPNSGDNDDTAAEAALKSRFPMKTITNLASFPNPAQTTAKNILAKARTANLNRADTPSSFTHGPPEVGKDLAPPPSPYRSTPSDLTSVNALNHDSRGRVELGQDTRLPPSGPRAQRERAANQGWAGYRRTNGFGTLSTGPGAPQPLTAGPPGHRQYKPSTFEGPPRALQVTSEPAASRSQARLAECRPEKVSSLREGPDSYLDRGVRGDNSTAGQHFSSLGGRSTPPVYSSIAELRSEQLLPDFNLAQKAACSGITDTLPPEAVKKYFPHGFPLGSFSRRRPIKNDWVEEYPIHRRTLRPSTQEETARRQRKADSAFYAGTGWLGKTMDNTIQELHQRLSQVKDAKRRTTPAEDHGGMVTYPPMTVEEANAHGDPEHVGALLNMSFATFLSYAEEYSKQPNMRGWRSGFVTPDKALIVDTDEGNKSFFDDTETPEGVIANSKTGE